MEKDTEKELFFILMEVHTQVIFLLERCKVLKTCQNVIDTNAYIENIESKHKKELKASRDDKLYFINRLTESLRKDMIESDELRKQIKVMENHLKEKDTDIDLLHEKLREEQKRV